MIPSQGQSIVFYDGVCVLCDGLVRFLIQKDKEEKLLFTPLQNDQSSKTLSPFGLEPTKLDSILFLSNNQVYQKSDAVLQIIQLLPFNILSLLLIFKIFPRFINDIGYDVVAKIRYKVFGKRDVCRLPTPHEVSRFLQ